MRWTVVKSNEGEAQDRNCKTPFSFNGAESGLKLKVEQEGEEELLDWMFEDK